MERAKDISEQTKQVFFDAFWQLYEKKDISRIRVQEICDIAGYHRNTFYHHFANVYDVLSQIEDRIIKELIANSDDSLIFSDAADSAERFSKVYKKNKKYLRLLADEEKGSHFHHKMTRLLNSAYKKFISFSSDKDEDECIHEYHCSGSVAVIMQYFRGESALSLEEIHRIAIELSKYGKWPMQKL